MNRLFALGLTVVLTLAACGEGDAATQQVTVFAASSLTEAFTRIRAEFERATPGTKVVFSFGASSTLARQISDGAPADVFASAAPEPMTRIGAEAAAEPRTFARNELVIAVPKDNPKGVTRLADLAEPVVKVALCAAQVPCGAAARTALRAGKVTLTPVTEEQDVKAALSKVRLGEVDAALVYRTDARAAAADVTGIDFPESVQAINDYLVAPLRRAPNRPGADAFVSWVTGAASRAALQGAGFALP